MPNDELPPVDELEEEEVTELFPGFEEAIAGYRLSLTDTGTRIQEVESQIMAVSERMERVTRPELWRLGLEAIVKGIPRTLAARAIAAPFSLDALSNERNALIDELEILSDQQVRNLWGMSLYEALPMKIQQGEITSYEDLLAHPAFRLPGITGEDRAAARAAFDSISAVLGRTEVVGKLDATEQDIIQAMAEQYRPQVPLAGVHQLSVEELVKGFQARYQTAPPALSLADVNAVYREAGMPEELIQEAQDLAKMSSDYDDYWAEVLASQELARAGLEEARMPEMSLKDQLLLAIESPGAIALDVFGGYVRHWLYPWASTLFRARIGLGQAIGRPLNEPEQNFMAIYEEARATDDWWHAGGKAWEEAELGWGNRLVYEWVLDPVNLIGFGVYTKLASKLPWAGKWLGPLSGRLEFGWLKMWDRMIFDPIKRVVRRVPKTPMQAARSVAAEDFSNVIRYISIASGGKYYTQVPLDDVTRLLIKARNFALKHPEDLGPMGRAGRAMLRQTAIDEAGVKDMLTKVGVTLDAPISRDMLTNVNLILSEVSGQTTGRLLTLKTAPPLLLRALTAHETADSLKAAKGILTALFRGTIGNSNNILKRSNSVARLLSNIYDNTQTIAFKSSESLAAHNLEMTGKLMSAVSRVSWLTMNIWRTKIDRWAVTPFARMYLVFAAYGPGNAFEGYMKPVFARVNPFWRRGVDPIRKVQVKWAGTLKPLDIETAVPYIQTSPEIPSALGIERSSAALLKWRRFWSAYNVGDWMIDRWGRLGAQQRSNYWDTLATRYLAEEEAPDLMRALATRIDDFTRGISDNMLAGLRLTRGQLNNELLDRAMAGPAGVRGMIDDAVATRIAKTGVSRNTALGDNIAAGQIQELAVNYTLVPDAIQENAVRRAADGRLWARAGAGIDDFYNDARLLLYDNYLTSPELFQSRYSKLAKDLIDTVPANKPEFLEKLKMLDDMVNFYSESSSKVIRGAREMADEMHIYAGDYESLLAKQKYYDDVWTGLKSYMDSADDTFAKTVDNLKLNMELVKLPADQRESVLKLFDMWTDQVKLTRATRLAQRSAEETLLAATPPGRARTAVFWQKFREAQSKPWRDWEISMAGLKEKTFIQQDMASRILGTAGPPPPMVDAAGRQLTKMDVATIFQSHPRSMPQAVMHMENMTIKGKPQFIAEVRAQAEIMARAAGRSADDLGFTRANIEAVYDQAIGDMLIDPARASVLEPQLMELTALKSELWNVYDTKGLPRGTVEAMNEKLGGLADDLAKVPGYMAPPTKPPVKVAQLSDDFLASRQRAANRASQEYFKDWADYTNETALTAIGRCIYPFWVYETHRLFWVPRNMIRFPGMFKAWGSYMNNTEDGYIPIPGTSLQANPLRGTIWMGGAIRLIRQDYPEYYDMVPGISETLDYLSRFGFYPAAYINTIKAFAGAKSARGRMLVGELLPATIKTPLNAYLALHGDSKPAQALTQILVPDIYREYVVMIFASRLCQERGLDFSGRHIWDKLKQGLALTDEEQKIWGEATKKYGLYGVLMEQGGIFRIRSDQQVEAWEEAGKLIEEATGLTVEQQLWIRRHGYRVSDYAMVDPATQDLLRELDSIKYWSGIFTVLFPSSWQEEDRRRGLFWSSIRDLDDARLSDYEENERRVRAGEISFRQWNRRNSQIAGKFRDDFDAIANSEEYRNIPIGLFDELDDEGNVTRKGLATIMEERGQLPPVLHPADEILNMYYSIELEETFDPVSEAWYIDWDNYFWKVDSIVTAVGEDRRPDLVAQITKNMSELRRLYWQVSREYFRPYNRVQTVQLELYDETQKAQIRRFLVTPSDAERDALREILTPDGTKLISGYQAEVRQARVNMRLLNPELDAWLLFFQITQKTLSDEAQHRYTELRVSYGIQP